MRLLNVADLGLDAFSDGPDRHALHSGETLHNFTKVVSFVQHWILVEPPSTFSSPSFFVICEGCLYACLFNQAYRAFKERTLQICTLSRLLPQFVVRSIIGCLLLEAS